VGHDRSRGAAISHAALKSAIACSWLANNQLSAPTLVIHLISVLFTWIRLRTLIFVVEPRSNQFDCWLFWPWCPQPNGMIAVRPLTRQELSLRCFIKWAAVAVDAHLAVQPSYRLLDNLPPGKFWFALENLFVGGAKRGH
jgi:hypothetical protein